MKKSKFSESQIVGILKEVEFGAKVGETCRKHEVPEELLASLLTDYKKLEDLIGENSLLKQLTKRLVEKALEAELTEHLGHDRHEAVANASGNTRNGKRKKTLKGEFGELPIYSMVAVIATTGATTTTSPSTSPS